MGWVERKSGPQKSKWQTKPGYCALGYGQVGTEWGKEKEQDYHSQVLVKQSQAGHWLFMCLNESENYPCE